METYLQILEKSLVIKLEEVGFEFQRVVETKQSIETFNKVFDEYSSTLSKLQVLNYLKENAKNGNQTE